MRPESPCADGYRKSAGLRDKRIGRNALAVHASDGTCHLETRRHELARARYLANRVEDVCRRIAASRGQYLKRPILLHRRSRAEGEVLKAGEPHDERRRARSGPELWHTRKWLAVEENLGVEPGVRRAVGNCHNPVAVERERKSAVRARLYALPVADREELLAASRRLVAAGAGDTNQLLLDVVLVLHLPCAVEMDAVGEIEALLKPLPDEIAAPFVVEVDDVAVVLLRRLEYAERAGVALLKKLGGLLVVACEVARPEDDLGGGVLARPLHHLRVEPDVAVVVEEKKIGIETADVALELVAKLVGLEAADGEVLPDEIHGWIPRLQILHEKTAPELPDDRLPVEENAHRGRILRRRLLHLLQRALDVLERGRLCVPLHRLALRECGLVKLPDDVPLLREEPRLLGGKDCARIGDRLARDGDLRLYVVAFDAVEAFMRVAGRCRADDLAAVAGPRTDRPVCKEARSRIWRRHLGEEIPSSVRSVDLGGYGRVGRAVQPHLRALREAVREVDLHAQLYRFRENPLDERRVRACAGLVLYPVLHRTVLENVFRAAGDVPVDEHLAVEERQTHELAAAAHFIQLARERRRENGERRQCNCHFSHRKLLPFSAKGMDRQMSSGILSFRLATCQQQAVCYSAKLISSICQRRKVPGLAVLAACTTDGGMITYPP